jgi:hypothetical protein
MRRLFTYLNSLLLGVILGLIFVAIAHTTSQRHKGVCTNGVVISYQILGEKQQKTFLLIAGRATHLAAWPPEICGQSVSRGYRLASPIMALSISTVRPAKFTPACALRK